MKNIILPLSCSIINELHVGDEVSLSGKIYTARDQAHKGLIETIRQGKKPTIDLKNQIIYYCGPTNAPKDHIIGSCGPTTSARMDEFTPALLKAGLKGMIGKGSRSKEVIDAIKRYKAVYFITYAGCGALLSKYIIEKKLAAYQQLGPEAIYRLEVLNFPVIVAVDSNGKDIFKKRI